MNRVAIKRFSKTLRHKLLKAVRICFDEYNEQGGAIVQMQDKNLHYFSRACIYAIYTDQPTEMKCALTGSACPVCYTRQCDMACAKTRNLVYRWDGDMALKKRNYKSTIENKGTTKEQRQMRHTNSTQLGTHRTRLSRNQTIAISEFLDLCRRRILCGNRYRKSRCMGLMRAFAISLILEC
jgi:hypothetical protein